MHIHDNDDDDEDEEEEILKEVCGRNNKILQQLNLCHFHIHNEALFELSRQNFFLNVSHKIEHKWATENKL